MPCIFFSVSLFLRDQFPEVALLGGRVRTFLKAIAKCLEKGSTNSEHFKKKKVSCPGSERLRVLCLPPGFPRDPGLEVLPEGPSPVSRGPCPFRPVFLCFGLGSILHTFVGRSVGYGDVQRAPTSAHLLRPQQGRWVAPLLFSGSSFRLSLAITWRGAAQLSLPPPAVCVHTGPVAQPVLQGGNLPEKRKWI